MGDRFGRIPVVTFPAVVAVSTGGRVSTVETNTTGDPTGHLEQLHVEAAAPCVTVAVADCE